MPFNNDKSTLVLLVQNARTLFCYFNNSSVAVKEFKDRYGEDSWNNSKPVIKVYAIENGSAKEIKNIIIDSLTDNWYINLDRDNIDVFIKIGRLLPDDTFVELQVSNTVTTPRSSQSNDNSVYYVDVSQSNSDVPYEVAADEAADEADKKPYPFMEGKKKLKYYPNLIEDSKIYDSEFIEKKMEELRTKYHVGSSEFNMSRGKK